MSRVGIFVRTIEGHATTTFQKVKVLKFVQWVESLPHWWWNWRCSGLALLVFAEVIETTLLPDFILDKVVVV